MARKSSLSKTLVWVIMALLFVGLAGFGAVNFSGTVRTIGEVGDKPIAVRTYSQALQNQLARLQQQTGQQISFREAETFGLPQQVLGQLLTSRALEHEAFRLGFSIGDEELARTLSENQSFQGPDGKFDREAYRFALRNAGLSESQFEEQMRDETARTVLQAAIVAGNTMPDSYARTILSYAGETRDFTWIARDGSTYAGALPEPSAEDLRAYYDENIAEFTKPEVRRITYASVSPDMLTETIEVDEALLIQAYDARSAEFNLPERRLIERLVFPSEDAAAEALARIEAGETVFEQVVAERGLEMADVDMGDVEQSALGDAGEGVFAAEVGVVSGPFPSEFGPALFRVNARLPAQVTTFEDARDQLREELVLDRARREIGNIGDQVDDLLAGGATLEEVAQDTPLEIGQIDWYPGLQEGIAAYDSFRDRASGVEEGDYPEVAEMDDGGIFALRLDEIVPSAPEPFEEVEDRVRDAWNAARLTEALAAEAEALKVRLDAGEAIEALGVDSVIEEGLTRTQFVSGLPASVLETVFGLETGQTAVISVPGRAILVRLDAVTPVDYEAEDVKQAMEQLEAQAAASMADDLLSAVAQDVRARAGVRIDQNALNLVHAQFQ